MAGKCATTRRGRLRTTALCPAHLAAFALAAALSGGCVSLESFCGPEQPPVGRPCRLLFSNVNMTETLDSVNDGKPLRGFAGRLYQVGIDSPIPLMSGEGVLTVDLYDDRPLAAGGQPINIERWQFPDDVLKKLIRKDLYGWGYTLFLPWVHTYRPDITLVHLHLCYVPKGGSPLYANTLTIPVGQGDPHYPQGVARAGGPYAPAGSATVQASAQVPVAARPPAPVPTAPQGPIQVPPQVAPAPVADIQAQVQMVPRLAPQAPVQSSPPVRSASWVGMAKQ